MNDYFLFTTVLMIGCLLAFAVVLSLYGRDASLCDAKQGEVFSFEYLQPLTGERIRHKAKVVEPVVRLSDRQIEIMNRTSNYRKKDPDFERTNHLVTCQVEDGEYRQFYCERAVNCRKPLFGRLLAT